VTDLDAVMAIETRRLQLPLEPRQLHRLARRRVSGAEMLIDADGTPIGYFVAMPGVDEIAPAEPDRRTRCGRAAATRMC
jgi:hypothetical protein